MKNRVQTARRAILKLIEAPNGVAENPFRSVAIDADNPYVKQALARQVAEVIYEAVDTAPGGAFMSTEFRSALTELIRLSRGWWGRFTIRHVILTATLDCFEADEIQYWSFHSVEYRRIYDLIVAKSQ